MEIGAGLVLAGQPVFGPVPGTGPLTLPARSHRSSGGSRNPGLRRGEGRVKLINFKWERAGARGLGGRGDLYLHTLGITERG